MSAEGAELKDEQIPTQEEGVDDEVRVINDISTPATTTPVRRSDPAQVALE
jgi:hypothetical protein